ncbi:MAG: rod shape-determining protein RodA [Candidatus Doudnabacteria bacterium]
MSIVSTIKSYDIPLLLISGLLLMIGLAVQYAISLGEGDLQVFWRQFIYVVLASGMFWLFSNYNYRLLTKVNRLIYALLIFALLYLLWFGDPIRGSARWIDFGFFRLQPAELAKLSVGIGLSRWLYINRGQINKLKNIFLTFGYAAVPAILIAREPDLGSSLVVMAIWFGLILISPIRKIFVVSFIIAGLIFAGASWQFLLHDYQKQRVEVFLNPDLDPQGQGYNVRQAIISVGSGQIWGRGLGKGVQSQLKFLPEKHTDFVFAASSEEIGFLGSASIVVLFFLLLQRLIKIMKTARDNLGRYLSGAILFLFASQVIVNLGMNLGLLPVTGIPLPLITFGGSSMLVSGIALGIAQNIVRQSRIMPG